MKSFTRLLLAFGISMLLVASVMAQYSQSITVTDSAAGNTKTLTLATQVGATYNIDAGTGEQELPPTPPSSIFDVRCVGIPGHDASLGQGSLADVRQYRYKAATDTFLVTFQASAEGIDSVTIGIHTYKQVTLSWLAAPGLKSVAGGGWKIVDATTGGSLLNVDMTTQSSTKIDARFSSGIYIIVSDSLMLTTFSYERLAADPTAVKALKGNKRSFKAFAWPDVYNVGEEIDIFNKTALGSITGGQIGSDPIQSVAPKKFSDLLKSVQSKGNLHSPDSVWCLDYDHSKKWAAHKPAKTPLFPVPLKKQLKTLEPKPAGKAVLNSYLFAQLATLKFNLEAATALQKVPAGLASLTIGAPAPVRFRGITVAQFVDSADHAFSCLRDTDGHRPDGGWQHSATLQEVCDLLKSINTAFNKSVPDTAHLDTLPGFSWICDLATLDTVKGKVKPKNPKAGGLRLAGQVGVSSVAFLTSGSAAATIDHQSVMGEAGQVREYRLNQNYPNPFNPTTNISFQLPSEGLVTVRVFNMLGQEVATLVNGMEMNQGVNEVTFNASEFSSGAYFYRIQVNDAQSGKVMFQDVKKMMLVK